MSLFRVNLTQGNQGNLDLDPSGANMCNGNSGNACLGPKMQPSVQRTMYVTGPHLTYRKLYDSFTFSDCNYWKRYTTEVLPPDQAFIEILEDDGSVWSDDGNNTFPYANVLSVPSGSSFLDTYFDVLGTYGSYAVNTHLQNLGTNVGTQSIQVQLNGSSSAVFTLQAGTSQVFDGLSVSKIAFQGSGSAATTVNIILSVQSVCAS